MRFFQRLYYHFFKKHIHHNSLKPTWSFYYYLFGNEEEHPHSHKNPHHRMTEKEITELNDQKDENRRLEREYQFTPHEKRKHGHVRNTLYV